MMATKAELQKEIGDLRKIGRQLSNVCFNLSQHYSMTADDREFMKELVKQWDAITRNKK